jgi:hypothetical protein
MGAAAMLRNQWQDATFAIGSLNQRTPFDPEDELLVIASPDPQGPRRASPELSACQTAAAPMQCSPEMASPWGQLGSVAQALHVVFRLGKC